MKKCSLCNIERPMVFKFYGKHRHLGDGEHMICLDCLAERMHHDDLVPQKD